MNPLILCEIIFLAEIKQNTNKLTNSVIEFSFNKNSGIINLPSHPLDSFNSNNENYLNMINDFWHLDNGELNFEKFNFEKTFQSISIYSKKKSRKSNNTMIN